MIERNSRRGLALTVALIVLAAACVVDDSGDSTGGEPPSLSGKLKAEQVEPFSHEELPSIQANEMHELHFAGGAHCGDCHPTTEPMPIQQAHDICADCHPQQTVARRVWENHCLACHHFTQAAQEFERDPQEMVSGLCDACHLGQGGLGGTIYALSGHATDEMVICDHCHRPHESDAPAAASLCANCHAELEDVRHPAGGTAKCSICHGAHRPPPEGTTLCTTCHGQAEGVLVHQIPNHPEDCLACHNAHFTTIEIKGVCVDCHEGMVYRGGLHQPSGHRDCENCHKLEDFAFRGNYICASCHEQEGAVRQDDRVPAKHKRCTTCHHPHTWRATFERNCELCHELPDVTEHQLPFHPTDCEQCHDPHHTADMTPSGRCAACHSGVPSFGTGVPEMHLACENCHPDVDQADYSFAGAESSCQICHADALTEPATGWAEVPSGHLTCTACHATHSWRLASVDNSCAVCHGDVVGAAPNEMHGECFNCHQQDHGVQFVGVDGSCRACHFEPPATHSAAGHADCFNCHAPHTFAADTSACTICHADKAEDHYPDNACTECHTFRE